MSRTPDVSVIVAVYNTMPYVTRCVESVLSQTIGADRLELIAVDDGSTDGGGEELDRFAREHPDTVTVVHQENSGGPAAPSNVALGLAQGRYVFFLGSDDHLGPEALERMVAVADDNECDVVLGKMIGEGGRRAPKAAFEEPGLDVPFPLSKAVWALSNTKLFRREPIERHGLRFMEDVAVYSDVPFTIEAMALARRIATLTDYEYYYTVERDNAANVTYSSKLSERLHATRRIVETVTRLYGPGEERDALLYRVFAYEQWILLQEGLLDLDEEGRRGICDGVAELADAHLTDAMRAKLPVEKRVRFAYAQRRDLDGLRAAIEFEGPPRFVAEGERAFARYPGFRASGGPADESYELIGDTVLGRIANGTEPVSTAWTGEGGGPCLELVFRVPVSGLAEADLSVGAVRLKQGKRPRKRRSVPAEERLAPQVEAEVALTPDGEATVVRARLRLRELEAAARPSRWSLRWYLRLADRRYDLPLRAPRSQPSALRGRRRSAVERDDRDRIIVRLHRRGPRAALKRCLRRLGLPVGGRG
ncbi:glycosyltransferase family 2 protein [Glycomyces tenuis]|uniref:glycosyltransferase family 2 protein n=1 Tax=Glycomyces tenuis TaxID=58116 RepID=UPI000429008E|nr:glycosyltransferase [Glycomyces tenuis]